MHRADIDDLAAAALALVPALVFIGYTGWGPGQLEGEIEEGSWLCLDFEQVDALGGDDDACWSDALARLGVNPMAFMMMGKMGSA